MNEDIGKLAANCTSQAPVLDTVGDDLAIWGQNFGASRYCWDPGSPVPGHLNWGIVTYQGDFYWGNWSGGFPNDEDLNFALRPPGYYGLCPSLPNEEPPNIPSILWEFKSLETFDAFKGSPWWQNFRTLAESCSGGSCVGTSSWEQASKLMNGPAIVTGQLAIDGAHETGYTELHPLYSMAVRTDSTPDSKGSGIDETWEFFIRTQGNEGSCSQMIYSWPSVSGASGWPDSAPYYIQLPWPKDANGVAATGVDGIAVTAYPWENGDTVGQALYTPGKWTYLQFNLKIDPAFDTGRTFCNLAGVCENVGAASGFDGEVKLHYTFPKGATLQAEARALQSTGPNPTNAGSKDTDEVDVGVILKAVTDPAVKTRLAKMLATPPPTMAQPTNPPIAINVQPTLYTPRTSLGAKGVLTRARTSVNPLAAREADDVWSAQGYAPVTFQALPGAQSVFVLGRDRNLWLEQAPFGKVPPTRQQVDGNVLAFQALDAQNIFVLGTDRNLWFKQAPFGKVPPARQQVDGNVRNFQALDAAQVLVVGTDDKLWLEQAPFGKVPPARQQVDGNVWSFYAPHGTTSAFVLGADGNLWLEQPPYGKVPPARQQVDANVQSFKAATLANWVWTLGNDGNLWLEQGPFGKVPPTRKQIDGNVRAFQPLDLDHALVLGTDGNLWLEQSPFGKVPPNRVQVDGNVR